MARKRVQEEIEQLDVVVDVAESSPEEKRRRLPAFAAAIAEAVKVHTLQNFCSVLEPLLRRIVYEQVQRALECISAKSQSSTREISGSASRILQLKFRNRLDIPIFTGSKIKGEHCCLIHVVLMDASTGQIVTAGPESSMKVEIVVLEGDFEGDEEEYWTEEDFDNHVVRERKGKRPLLIGELIINLKEGVGVLGELRFTDNSSWLRSRKFKLGARVTVRCSNGIRIREAKTEAFTVKDHRGEHYKKNYPPALQDNVWRLDKIGKDGKFHKRLKEERIYTVQDFLRLVFVDPQRLQHIAGMSNKTWEKTIDHAKTCVLDNKLYAYYGNKEHSIGVVFNVICELQGLIADGQYIHVHEISETQKLSVSNMVKYAHDHWNEVIEYDASPLTSILPTLPTPAELTDGQGGQADIRSQLAGNSVMHQHYQPFEPSNSAWMSYPAENSDIATPSEFALREYFDEQDIVPQTVSSPASALGAQQLIIPPLQSACDIQNPGSYHDYAHQGIQDQCVESGTSRDNWNGCCDEGSEGFFIARSGDKLASELENKISEDADFQAEMQSWIQIITAGTSDNLVHNMQGHEAFAFSVFTPPSDGSFNVSTGHGRTCVFWIKLKIAFKWGISIRKVAAAKRARLEQTEACL